jgi:hypothetical protein
MLFLPQLQSFLYRERLWHGLEKIIETTEIYRIRIS